MDRIVWEIRLKMGDCLFSVPSDSYSAEEGFYCCGRAPDDDFLKRFLDCMQDQNTRKGVFQLRVSQLKPVRKTPMPTWTPVIVHEVSNNAFSNSFSFKVTGRESRALEGVLEEIRKLPADRYPGNPGNHEDAPGLVIGRPMHPGDFT